MSQLMASRIAFSVGIDKYIQSPLSWAVSDTVRCYDELTKAGITCIKCFDADLREFDKSFTVFQNQISHCHNFILFNFNGHCEFSDGKATLVFVDGETGSGGRMLVDTVMERLLSTKCSCDAEFLFLMNCCRDGPMKGDSQRDTINDACQPGQSRRGRSKGHKVYRTIWAGSIAQGARDGDASNCGSTFMRAFVQCVGTEFSLDAVYGHIYEAVVSHDRHAHDNVIQEPCFSGKGIVRRANLLHCTQTLPSDEGSTRVHVDPRSQIELAIRDAGEASPVKRFWIVVAMAVLILASLDLYYCSRTWAMGQSRGQGFRQASLDLDKLRSKSISLHHLETTAFVWAAVTYNRDVQQHCACALGLEVSKIWKCVEEIALEWLPLCGAFYDMLAVGGPVPGNDCMDCMSHLVSFVLIHLMHRCRLQSLRLWREQVCHEAVSRAFWAWMWIFAATIMKELLIFRCGLELGRPQLQNLGTRWPCKD